MNYEYDKSSKMHYCIICSKCYFNKYEVYKHFKTDQHNIEYLTNLLYEYYDKDTAIEFILNYPSFNEMDEVDKMNFAKYMYDRNVEL